MAGFYEITEWGIAAAAAPEVGAAYLGSQGDIWDAQKDMMLDSIGGVVSVLLLSGLHNRQILQSSNLQSSNLQFQ